MKATVIWQKKKWFLPSWSDIFCHFLLDKRQIDKYFLSNYNVDWRIERNLDRRGQKAHKTI